MNGELPCGDSADARYCPKFWEQDAEIKRLGEQLADAQAALGDARNEHDEARHEIMRLHGVIRDALTDMAGLDPEETAQWLHDHDVPDLDDEPDE